MPKVFVADDSALARAFTIRSIQMSGVPDCEFFEAANGLEVMQKIRSAKPDLIISDINMPKCNGIDLSRRLKADPDLCDIPIIIMSSAGNHQQRTELEDLGVNAIISKPFTPTDIISIATNLLAPPSDDDDEWGTADADDEDGNGWGDDEEAATEETETEGEW